MIFGYIAQGVGILASAIIIFGYTQKSDHRFKLFILAGSLAFAIHFYLLGANTGVVVNIINFFLTAASLRFKKSNLFMAIFIMLYIAAGFITYENPADILPAFAGVVFTFSMFKLSGIPFRLCLLVVSGSWLTYGIVQQSLGSIITELFAQVTNATTIFRLYLERKNRAA